MQPSGNTLPPDPWAYNIPHPAHIITFQNCKTKGLNQKNVYSCPLTTVNAVIAQLSTGGDGFIDAAELQTNVGHVRLVLRP